MANRSSDKTIILNKVRDEYGSRLLEVELKENGDLVIMGQDLGKAVQEILGVFEYEWDWTIKAADIHYLEKALGNPKNLLSSLKENFGKEKSDRLLPFLKDNEIPFQVWRRYGY